VVGAPDQRAMCLIETLPLPKLDLQWFFSHRWGLLAGVDESSDGAHGMHGLGRAPHFA